MTGRDRLGLTLLAGGIGLALVNLTTWALGLGASGWRPALSGLLMVAGLTVLPVGIIRAHRAEE